MKKFLGLFSLLVLLILVTPTSIIAAVDKDVGTKEITTPVDLSIDFTVDQADESWQIKINDISIISQPIQTSKDALTVTFIEEKEIVRPSDAHNQKSRYNHLGKNVQFTASGGLPG